MLPATRVIHPSVALFASCPTAGNKVRAYLDHARVPYVVVEVDPVLKGQLSFSKYRKVPIAVVNGVQINDSSGACQLPSSLFLLLWGPRTRARVCG